MICPYQDLGQPEEDWCENPENCEIYKERIQEEEKLAKRNLMLTAEQREALEHVIEYVQETQMPISNLNEFDMQELRSLLTGSKPAWEVTEERKSAILDGMMAIARLQQIGEEQWGDEGEAGVLRAMLAGGKRDA